MCHAENTNLQQTKEKESAMKSSPKPVCDDSLPARRVKAQRAAPGSRLVYCVDLAKEHFHLNRYSAHGELQKSQALRRSQFEVIVSDPQRTRGVWVMEACASAHYWGRRLLALGDQVKLVPPQFVAKQRVGNKNDSNDAEAIFAVHLDARVHPVPVKTEAQQDQLAVHSARQQLIKARTAISNHLRSVLAERGYVTAKGSAALEQLLKSVTDIVTTPLSIALQPVIVALQAMLETLKGQMALLDSQIQVHVQQSAQAQQLLVPPGIGPITASAMTAEFAGGVARFSSARQFAAALGIAPGEHSSGGKVHLTAITKRGNEYLRKLLIQGAHTVVSSACPKPPRLRPGVSEAPVERIVKDDDLHVFARNLRARKPRKVVVVAVANRMARMVYAMLKHGTPYRAQRSQAQAKAA